MAIQIGNMHLNLFLFILIIMQLITISTNLRWRQNRKPRIMDLPMRSIRPNTKRTQNKIVLHHNILRSKVTPTASNMLMMKWHKETARDAQKWADHCKFLIHDTIIGRTVRNYGACGQNIFVASHKVPWLFAIRTWFLERDNFTYGIDTNDLNVVGHYTQMVWASSHQLGCGLSKCNLNNRVFYNYVCNYCPIGNRPGMLGIPYRLGTACDGCPGECHAKKLCTNVCNYGDYWSNCKELNDVWPNWLCYGKGVKGRERAANCKATCRCKNQIHD